MATAPLCAWCSKPRPARNVYCDRVCRGAAQRRDTEARRAAAPCACGAVGRLTRGMCVRCYSTAGRAGVLPGVGHEAVCSGCGKTFRTTTKDKPFCSHRCYIVSGGINKAVIAACAARGDSAPMLGAREVSCRRCGSAFTVRGKTTRTAHGRVYGRRSYCSRSCWRSYFADRFDRYVASHTSIDRVQCFDEFLSRDELPCLVAGCSWEGQDLTRHAFLAHGIPAEELKRRAGFNRTTGVIGRRLSAQRAEQCATAARPAAERTPEERAEIGAMRGVHTGYAQRAEAMEHRQKSAADAATGGA